MDVQIGHLETTVRAVDDRTLVSPDVLDVVVRAVLERLAQTRGAEEARQDEATMWPSVRRPR